MTRVALGLFHFNGHWGANPRSAHRHCSEALGPFLRAVAAHPHWRLDFEMSGAGLEFLAAEYPDQLALLRRLVEYGQVELISSLYTPSLWIAYPRVDLLRSIALNQRCLARLGLPWTRIFFAQEAFFGSALGSLSEFFDVAICKDDYLSYNYTIDSYDGCFRLGGVKVLVASGHIMNDLIAATTADPAVARAQGLMHSHVDYLQRAVYWNDPARFPALRGRCGSREWYWYHCGDGRYWTSIHRPDDFGRAYYDPVWARFCAWRMADLEAAGYRLGTIGDLVASLDYTQARELPPLIEGGWNAAHAEGVFCWMGREGTPAEDDAGVLTAVARARSRVCRAEQAVADAGATASAEMTAKLDRAWRAVLHGAISDALGWEADECAVASAMAAADQALLLATQVIDAAGAGLELDDADAHDATDPADDRGHEGQHESNDGLPAAAGDAPHVPAFEVFGAEATFGWITVCPDVFAYEVNLLPNAPSFGVRCALDADALTFCPSGLERELHAIPLYTFKPARISLPLANGLIQLADGCFLIKDTRYVHVAATVDVHARTLEFGIRGAPRARPHTWRFYIVNGSPASAIAWANRINSAEWPLPRPRTSSASRVSDTAAVATGAH